MNTKMIGEFLKPDKNNIGIFSALMLVLVAGMAYGLHIEGRFMLPDQVYQLLDSLHLFDSLFFLSAPIYLFASFIGVIVKFDVSMEITPFSFALDAVYFYFLSCLAAYSWEKRNVKEIQEILRPGKGKLLVFAVLAVLSFVLIPQGSGISETSLIVERTFPASFDSLLGGMVYMISLPALFVFDYVLAGTIIFAGYDPAFLMKLEPIYTLLILLNLYVFSGMTVYALRNRKRRSVIIIAALYLLFITATPILVQYSSENYPEITGDSTKCGTDETGQRLLECELYTDEGEKVYCISKVAIESECNVVCDNIKDINIREMCQMSVAGSTKNASICEGMRPDYQDNCYSDVGLATKDLSICEKINNSDMRDRCYSDVAIYHRDTSICDKTKIPGEKEWCVERIAVAKKDPELCDRIENGGNLSYFGQPNATLATRDLCYGATAEVTKDVSLCGKIDPKDLDMIDFCYEWVGVAKGDPLLCSKINGGPGRDRCYSGVAESKQNISDCDNVVQENRNACYLAAAKATKNLSMCEKIPLAYKKDECYSTVSIESGDVSLCGRIDTPYQKDTCYSRNAKRTLDLDLCKKVGDLYNRETCYREIGL
jgi:hypothetical protein